MRIVRENISSNWEMILSDIAHKSRHGRNSSRLWVVVTRRQQLATGASGMDSVQPSLVSNCFHSFGPPIHRTLSLSGLGWRKVVTVVAHFRVYIRRVEPELSTVQLIICAGGNTSTSLKKKEGYREITWLWRISFASLSNQTHVYNMCVYVFIVSVCVWMHLSPLCLVTNVLTYFCNSSVFCLPTCRSPLCLKHSLCCARYLSWGHVL
jgi:hypothetical protein